MTISVLGKGWGEWFLWIVKCVFVYIYIYTQVYLEDCEQVQEVDLKITSLCSCFFSFDIFVIY